MQKVTFSIIVETENLAMAGLDDLRGCLDSLAAQTRPITTASEVILVVGGHVPSSVQQDLAVAYPWTRILDCGRKLEYTLAKRLGAQSASGDVAIFADSDVRYEPTWLDSIMSCYESDPEADLVAGDTQSENGSAYAAAMNIMWMFNVQPRVTRPVPHTYFQLNNFAVRRQLLLETPFDADLPYFRGYRITHFKREMLVRVRRSYRVPGAQGWHTPPQTLFDWWYRMLIQGQDAIAYVAVQKRGGVLRRLAHVPRILFNKTSIGCRNAVNLIGNDRRNAASVLAALPLCVVCGAVIALGAIIAAFAPHYLLRKINAYTAGK